jgi:hypothetical protein
MSKAKKDKSEEYYQERDRAYFKKHGGRKGLSEQQYKHALANRSAGKSLGAAQGVGFTNTGVFEGKYATKRSAGIRITHKDRLLAKRIRSNNKLTTPRRKPGTLKRKSGGEVGGEIGDVWADLDVNDGKHQVCFQKKDGASVTFNASKSNSFCKK